MECVRETPTLKKETSTGCVREALQIQNNNNKTTIKKQKTNQHWMCKTNSPHKNKVTMGCAIKTPQIKIKPAWDA